MSIKDKIQIDYTHAVKAKLESKIKALRAIKTKISEAEKANKNQELVDDEIIKIITKSHKTLLETEKIYTDAGRSDLAMIEKLEADALVEYLPKQMDDSEIESEVSKILSELGEMPNKQALIGKTVGTFNKLYQGKADIQKVKTIIEKLLN